MRKHFLILFLVVTFFGFSQNYGNVVIDWLPTSKLSYTTFEFNIPQFKTNAFQFDYMNRQLFFNLNLKTNFYVDEGSLQIKNIVYQPISLLELGELNLKLIPNSCSSKLINAQNREEINSLITISPIVKEGNSYKKIISFDYEFNFSTTSKNFQLLRSISSSVLSSGEWYRFSIIKSGVYSLTKTFLDQLGLNMSGVDPRMIKIYGNGGRMIPLLNGTSYPNDLIENTIQVTGENDGVFNDGDRILFYGEGVDNWDFDSKTNGNLYEDKSYYYINVQGSLGKRMPIFNQPISGASTSITTFNAYQFHEIDVTNIGKLGRRWFGESFDVNNEQSFNFSFPNIVPGSQISADIYFAAVAYNSSNFNINFNNTSVGTVAIPQLFNNDGYTHKEQNFPVSFPAVSDLNIKLTYNNNGVPSSVGYLDYVNLNSINYLKGYGKQFRFQYNLSSSTIGVASYDFTNASAISEIWDVTDIYNVEKIENPNLSSFSFKANMGSLRKYVALDSSDFYTPNIDTQKKIPNQDLKGTIFLNNQGVFQDIDYLIVTPYFLGSQAEKLANFHRNYSGLNVKVVYLENIYPEFSSGKQDISAIRNFVKYVYNNASVPSKRVKYLNLFGDASYDFKNKTKNNTNIVPIYHSMTSNSLGEASFASDDFFGIMDPTEGNLDVNYGLIDIAVGRMIVSSNQQADQMVNKVIDYNDIKSYGNWRNNYVFVADDPSPEKTADNELQYYQNQLADKVLLEKPSINTQKILLDSYVQEASSGGYRYPKAREDFFNAFAKGALIVNYLGHGGEDGLAQERIWEKADGQNLSNKYRYPLFITLTCDFSRFDNPSRQTAGEFTYWNPNGGAIAMITTVREIGQTTAQNFNFSFADKLLAYGSNQYPSIGEALRLAKNLSVGSGKVIFCIGDPALMLAIPKPKVILTKVNNLPISEPIPDLKSLDFVTLSGEILDENNLPLVNYNGDLAVNLFDKNIPRNTLRNDSYDAYLTGATMPFVTFGETIFRGNASVTNGKFEFSFVVPRDIRIPLGNGRVSFYSKQNQTLLDNTGFNTDIKIGGVNLSAAIDVTPPKVRLYMNNESFVSGGITNESPLFLAFLEDENGINTASGIGHDLVAILDGNVVTPYILNDYYETELNNFKKGKLKFQFRKLAKGLHTLIFKGWDVYNNLVTAEIQFIVVGDETLTLSNVLNYPNPFVNYTQFWFSHNRPYEPLEVQVQVMTITGKVVWTRNEIITTDGFLSREITWDGRDDFGDKLGKGVYVYKLSVKSSFTNTRAEKIEKLVIL